MRRFAMLALSLSLLLGLSGRPLLFAQGDAKKDEAKKDDTKKDDTKKEEPKKAEAPKAEAPKEETPAPIPADVQKKIDAARRAVAEMIVAAQDAGLVKTTIDPPPVLDILITGRANDESTLKAKQGVNPEVFGAWFTGYGKSGANIVPEKDVRITQPSAGLKAWYDQRASVLTREIDAVRKAGSAANDAAKKTKDDAAAAAKNEQMKKDAAKAEQTKKDEADKKAKDDAAKAEQMKKDAADKKAKEDKEAADKKAKDDADKKAKDDADKKAKDDADKKAKDDEAKKDDTKDEKK